MKFKAAGVFFALLIALFTNACGRTQELATQKAGSIHNVKIETVSLASVDDYYEAVGTVRPATSSLLSARITGSVVALHVNEGDRVRAGQLLIEIDNRDATAQLQRAQAGLREAQESLEEVERSIHEAEAARTAADAQKQLAAKTLERYQTLLERKSVSPQEFDEVQAKQRVAGAEADRAERVVLTLGARRNQVVARIEQSKADFTAAQVSAGYARITSPINGLVTSKQTNVGQTATPGSPLLTVEDDSRYRLEAAVEESRSGAARRGDGVLVLLDAPGSKEFGGSVSEIVPTSDPASRSFTLKVDLPTDANKMGVRSGMFGRARFGIGQRQTIAVQQTAIVQRGQLTYLYVVDESGIAQLRVIKTGKAYGDRIEVLSGLSEGERIVIEGVGGINEGSRVQ